MISPHMTEPLVLCFHLRLVSHPGDEGLQQGKGFPSPLWFIQYLANLALNLPHEISSHFSPPLPAYVNYMPARPSSIPTCFFPLCFRNSSLREWETGPWRRLGFTLCRFVSPPLPTQCGSPTDHNVRPYRECTGGHLWFAGIQMNVYEACLAAKGQALSQLLQPLSWVYFLLWVSALTCAQLWGVFLGVWICDLQIPSCAVEVLLSGQQGERSLCLYSVRVCFTEP